MSSFVGANLTRTYTATQLANDGSAPGLGDVYHTTDGKKFRFVKFDNGVGNVAAVVGKAAYIFATSAASTGAIDTVTMDLTDALGPDAVLAGLFMSIPGDGEYCWIQTWGVSTVTVFTISSGADGAPIGGPPTAGTDGVITHCETTLTSGAVSAAAKAQYGYIIDASAKIIYLKCT